MPWTNKKLSIQWEFFRSLLEPGQEETWTAIITGPDATFAIAEMVAAMYDASLDLYLQHNWIQAFTGFRSESSRLSSYFENRTLSFRTVLYDWGVHNLSAGLSYRHFPYEIVYPDIYSYYYYWGNYSAVMARGGGDFDSDESYTESATTSVPDMDSVPMRTNLDETAFFYPHLISDSEGKVRIEFTMPETLTECLSM